MTTTRMTAVGAPLRVTSLAGLQRRYPVLQVCAVIALFAYGAATISGFTGRGSLYAMGVLASFLGLAALSQTLVVLLGGVDFAIPAYILLGETATLQLTSGPHWPAAAAIAAGVIMAAAAGAVCGLVCHRFRVQSLVVTLGMNVILTGLVQVWTKGYLTGNPPAWLMVLASPGGHTLGLAFPPVVVIWVATAIAVGVAAHRTATGRRYYAVGTNPRAASLARVRTGRFWIGVFALSGGVAALVGVLLAGFAGGDTGAGSPYLFESLAAVVVGGSVFGGRGDYWRTVIGALLITLLSTILVGHGLSAAAEQIIYGVVILLIVGGYGRDRHLRNLI